MIRNGPKRDGAMFSADLVTVKLPFPLTPQFKSMLQSGVGTRDLDVQWVSSLSWYFLTLFGLQPVYNFILGSNNGTSWHPQGPGCPEANSKLPQLQAK